MFASLTNAGFHRKDAEGRRELLYCFAKGAELNNCIMIENEISEKVIGCSIEVHRSLGPGLLEYAYVECLAFELLKCNLKIERQKKIPLIYKDVRLDCGYRADLVVEDRVIIEAKAVQP